MHEITLPLLITAGLTVFVGLVVLLTRLRLNRTHRVPALELHTGAGVLGLICWTLFLLAPADAEWSSIVGVVGLGCFWVVAVAGVVLSMRWRIGRSRGKRAAGGATAADSWSSTAWLSVLAHLGVLGSVVWFTFAYVTSVI